MSKIYTITTDQIEALRAEAGQAGDLDQVTICDRALDGDEDAIAECEAVITAARAVTDDISQVVAVRERRPR